MFSPFRFPCLISLFYPNVRPQQNSVFFVASYKYPVVTKSLSLILSFWSNFSATTFLHDFRFCSGPGIIVRKVTNHSLRCITILCHEYLLNKVEPIMMSCVFSCVEVFCRSVCFPLVFYVDHKHVTHVIVM